MTFEQVLKVFDDYIKSDTECEVLKNSHGYMTMTWDNRAKSWYDVVQCENPTELRDSLFEKYFNYECWNNFDGENDLSDEEKEILLAKCKKIIETKENEIYILSFK